MYSIVIPYLSSSKCIDRCKHYLELNKSLPYELVEIVDETDVYYAFNKGVYQSKFDKVILLNDDMIVSKGWDYTLLKYNNWETVTTGYVVEPNPGTNYRPNGELIEKIQLDCGNTIDTFDYDKFQNFVNSQTVPDAIADAKGWYMPICFDKKSFVSYPNKVKFPFEQNDVLLIDYILPNLGYKFAKVNSFVYHLQSQSLKELKC